MELKSLVKSLKRKEYLRIKNVISGFNKNEKQSQLLDAFYFNKADNDQEASELIYNEPPRNKYFNVKGSLFRNILEFLKTDQISEYDKNIIVVKRNEVLSMIHSSQLLLSRGLYKDAINSLKKANQTCTDFELFDLKIVVLNILKHHDGIKNGTGKYSGYSLDIEETRELAKNLATITNELDILRIHYRHSKSVVKEPKIGYQELNKQLENLGDCSKFERVQYEKLKFRILLSSHLNNKEETWELYNRLLDFVSNSKLFNSKTFIAGTKLSIASYFLQVRRYQEATQLLLEVTGVFEKGLVNYIRAKELMFLSYYYLNKLKKSKNVLKESLALKEGKDKLLLYSAMIDFKKCQFEKAYNNLNQVKKLLNDKGGWQIIFSYLELMVLYEMRDFDTYFYRLINLKTKVYKIKDEKSNRLKSCFILLSKLHSSAYNPNNFTEATRRKLKVLLNEAPGYEWNPLLHEVIRVDYWIASKMKVHPLEETVRNKKTVEIEN